MQLTLLCIRTTENHGNGQPQQPDRHHWDWLRL